MDRITLALGFDHPGTINTILVKFAWSINTTPISHTYIIDILFTMYYSRFPARYSDMVLLRPVIRVKRDLACYFIDSCFICNSSTLSCVTRSKDWYYPIIVSARLISDTRNFLSIILSIVIIV